MNSPVLDATNLSFAYDRGETVFHHVSLDVAEGSRTALLGKNGSGKTTLLLLLSGNRRAQKGTIRLEGSPLGYGKRELNRWREQVGIVFQNPDDQLFSSTLYEDISFGPCNQGLADREVRHRVEEAMELMELTHLAERPVHLLSHGEKKRTAIAGVLAMKPRILLFDEPTAGLDPEATPLLREILKKLTGQGTTLLFSTHDMDFAYSLADDAVVIEDRSSLVKGEPGRLFTDEALLQKAKLAPPHVLQFQKFCEKRGWISGGDETKQPRTMEEFYERFGGSTPPA